MQVDERTRHEVFGTLREKLGETAAVLLMAAIPPFDWAHVATKEDVARLEAKLYRALLIQFFAIMTANIALISAFAR